MDSCHNQSHYLKLRCGHTGFNAYLTSSNAIRLPPASSVKTRKQSTTICSHVIGTYRNDRNCAAPSVSSLSTNTLRVLSVNSGFMVRGF